MPLVEAAPKLWLRRMARDDLTAHVFRSTFRDWTVERTNSPREVAEQARGGQGRADCASSLSNAK
jgi:hypothetical protein